MRSLTLTALLLPENYPVLLSDFFSHCGRKNFQFGKSLWRDAKPIRILLNARSECFVTPLPHFYDLFFGEQWRFLRRFAESEFDGFGSQFWYFSGDRVVSKVDQVAAKKAHPLPKSLFANAVELP